jgi:hypothetical protein
MDTLGITCKHLFIVFEWYAGAENISLGPGFVSWDMYSKNEPTKKINIKGLINENKQEGNMAVIGSVRYLQEMMDNYDIIYNQ